MVSAEHENRIGEISGFLDRLCIRHYINRQPGGPDIVAYMMHGRVAIEYETGKKRFDETVAMIERRRGGYSRVIVIVNDRFAAKYKKSLERGNVSVVEFSWLGRLWL